ncbi:MULTISPECIES: glycosyltransferase family 4 protein [Nocardiopsidaceae]|uniref:Glycosyltransferase family 4 protein n=1 Tax=Streptomonospora nanhaiensis TaxID=1323731 RepID=A0ABY6YP56_9ACTN|nr:glycosyltransferase family 4 protein [Streptomonospora nanhaiensis]WAE74040.1 glycosyltransferase family 4 protein [Streptomonospora nanhaiensis]
MRLLIITSSFHPVIGGAETYAWEVAEGLAARGHDVVVVTDLPRGHHAGEVFAGDPEGVDVRRLSRYHEILADPSKIHWEQMAYGLMPEIRDVIDEFRPDLVLTNSMDAALLGKTVSLDRGIPWVATFHEHSPQDEPLGAGRLRLVHGVLKPSLVLAGGAFYAERAAEWGPGNPVELIYHGVDTERFHPGIDGRPVREHHGLTDQETLFVLAGRLKPRKGIREAISAFDRVRRACPGARLLIVGSVSSASLDYSAQLDADIAALDLQQTVTIDRTVTFDRMPGVLAAADVVVQPSFEEGLGISVLEAMSMGKPVVTTDIVGVRELLTAPGVARVVPPGAPEPLAHVLIELAGSAEERSRLGKAAREHVVGSFSKQRMVERTESVLLTRSTRREAGHV